MTGPAMRLFGSLFEQFKAYHAHGRPVAQYTGMVAMAAFPLFYLLRFTKAAPPFDDLWFRVIGALLCAGLALRSFWPQRLRPYYLAYWYWTLLYCLPFFFIFTSLANNGGVVSVANTLMAVFFLILLTDWRNTILMLVVGGAAASLLYVTVIPEPALPMDYVARLPIVVLVMIGGSLFKFAEKQAEAEKVKRTYTALAGSIAHEMRNPLSQIMHNLENMQQALPLPTTSAQPQALAVEQVDALYLHLAQSELAVKRGLQVIAMTLDEVSAKPVDTTRFSYLSAASATRKAAQEYGYADEADRDRVSVNLVEDFNFRGDETAYLFVLFNLMKNALYYLALDPDVRVAITVDRQQVKVRDTGPGIAPDALKRLFEPFRSVGKSGGTGLGLAYCQRVMRALGGDITCQSALGEYTEFTLTFPPVGEQETDAHRLSVLARAQEAFAGKRILVVDDDSALRMTTRHKLQPLGAAIDEAGNGQRALEMLSSRRYDLVVLDLNMPVLDGYAVAESVRQGATPDNRDVCIVACTSEPPHLAGVKTQKAGMDGLVAKPCAQLPLIQALLQALEHPRARSRPDTSLLAGLHVLLADDNAINRKAVAAYLKHAGAQVVDAAHGQAVLDYLTTQGRCDAILMDINMPGMDGLEAARAIRAAGQPWSSVPIIALTAHADHGTVLAAGAAGMNDFITKPVDADMLYAKLRKLSGWGAAGPGTPAPARAAATAVQAEALLDLERLASYRRIGMLDELLQDYLPEITRLIDQLDRGVARQDLQESLDALHSLVGMSGEAGAAALYELARGIYVPMVENRRWPPAGDWLDQIKRIATRTDAALKAHGAARTDADIS